MALLMVRRRLEVYSGSVEQHLAVSAVTAVMAVTVTGQHSHAQTYPRPENRAASDSMVMPACWAGAPWLSSQAAALEAPGDSQGSFPLYLTLDTSCQCPNRLYPFETGSAQR